MSCTVCYGAPGCPCCGTDSMEEKCQVCDGTGINTYYSRDGEEILREEWEDLSEADRDQDQCPNCDGSGIIEYEFERDYDHDE